jgi:cytochrome c oxidase subunit 1
MLGLVPMLLGSMLYICTRSEFAETALDRLAFWTYGVAGIVFCFVFLAGGWQAVPRRFAVHDLEWLTFARLGTIAAVLVLVTAVILGVRLLARLPKASLAA